MKAASFIQAYICIREFQRSVRHSTGITDLGLTLFAMCKDDFHPILIMFIFMYIEFVNIFDTFLLTKNL